MSAPNTNLDKQKRRHWFPLIGMALVVIFGVIMIMFWLGEEAAQSDPASPPPTVNSETVTPEAVTPETVTPEAAPAAPATETVTPAP